jgi:sulfhydrogenase subunit beta (sulfur reductase)
MHILESSGLERLLQSLQEQEYELIGPTVRDGAVVIEPIQSATDLPRGIRDEQKPGHYRLKETGDDSWFSYVVGPHSWKKLFFPAERTLWKATRAKGLLQIQSEPPPKQKLALIGVRSCELEAMKIQDRVFMEGEYQDSYYSGRRKNNFILAVNCTLPGGTCFCASMDAGPQVRAGFDIVLTELKEDGKPRLVARAGTPRGEKLLVEVSSGKAGKDDLKKADKLMDTAAENMGRSVQTEGLAALLAMSHDDPHWEEIGDKCEACSSCTMVCPTCFCHTVEESTDLGGTEAKRVRVWDSCFTADHSYLHGGSVRATRNARYRQWMTHKLSTWHDQFGTAGCTGCGRCVTWCPVGIDITAEAKAFQAARG